MSLSAGRVGVRADQVDSHGRVISPSFLNELMEDLPEWTDLPVRVNGTEQLIPSNPSVPVTSPILADIDYPDERRNDQYFTYRESPTTVDGLAKIKSIKGNTLVWNQLHQNQNGKSETAQYAYMLDVGSNFSVPSGHKLLVFFTQPTGCEVYATGRTGISVTYQLFPLVTTPTVRSFIGTTTSNLTGEYMNGTVCLNATVSSAVQLTNCMIFDLTLMGLDVTVDQFRALFPLSYYAYNGGSLLSFNGTGIKTVGFNLFDPTSETINAYLRKLATNDVRWTYEADSRSVAVRCFPNTTYCVYANGLTPSILRVCSIAEELPSGTGWDIQCEKQFVNSTTGMTIFTTGANAKYLIIQSNKATFDNVKANLCISVSSGKNGTYEPYEENTTNLPTETYFPTGMKSAGSVYDELLPTKAITRIGAVDLGTLTWSYEGTNTSGLVRMSSTGIKDLVKKPSSGSVNANILCQLYTTKTADQTYLKNVGISINTGGTICIYDENYNTTDKISAFKTAMSGVYLYYELATPVELPTLSFE